MIYCDQCGSPLSGRYYQTSGDDREEPQLLCPRCAGEPVEDDRDVDEREEGH